MNKKTICLLIAAMFIIPSFALAETFTGTLFADVIFGTDYADEIRGLNGNDIIHGGAGNDYLYGNWGADTIYGDAGNDYIDGGLGWDTCYGGEGTDTLANCEYNFADQVLATDVMIVEITNTTKKIVGGVGTTIVVLSGESELSAFDAATDYLETDALINPYTGKKIVLENTENIVIE